MSRRIKVLMVGALPLDLESVRGGVEAAILNLFSGFRLLDDVEVVHVSFIQDLESRTEVAFAENIKIVFVPFKSSIRLLDYLVNRHVLRDIINEEAPDLIHIQESEPHLLRFLNIKKENIVVTQHGIMVEELKYASGLPATMKFVFKALVEKIVFPRFKHIIFISDYNKKLFKGTVSRSVNIYNAVNPIFFDHVPNGTPKPNTIVYIGVLSKRKNLPVVIQAIHELRKKGISYELHVVGWCKEDDTDYERMISDLVTKYDLSAQIKFHGWLRQTQILQVFDQCSIFVLPSLQETLPVSIAEAMAMGKIVIASDVGAISEMFDDERSGYLFGKNDVNKLVSLLEGLAIDQDKKARLAAEVKKTALEKYHPETNARKTLNFYREVIAGKETIR